MCRFRAPAATMVTTRWVAAPRFTGATLSATLPVASRVIGEIVDEPNQNDDLSRVDLPCVRAALVHSERLSRPSGDPALPAGCMAPEL
jgi:hypothetical protein